MKLSEKYTFDYIRKNGLLLFETLYGSYAYGTQIEGVSDRDFKGVFIMEKDDCYGMDYVPQVRDEKSDLVFYEIGTFLKFLLKNNPTVVEMMGVSKDSIIYKNPIFDQIKIEDFLSKLCKDTFTEYSREQIKKARGLNKKVVNPVAKLKKTPLDFCYVIKGTKSYKLTGFLNKNNMDQKFCGLVNIPNANGIFTMFYDQEAADCFSDLTPEEERKQNFSKRKNSKKTMGKGYRGIIKEDEGGEFVSNTIRLSSIPKGEKESAVISYNQNGYTTYCKRYKEYWDWVKDRNENRYKLASKKKYDVKNMMHCVRYLTMSHEIAKYCKVITKRDDVDLFMKIRTGQMEYDEVLKIAEELHSQVEPIFEASNLPIKPDAQKAEELLIKIRNEFYGKHC